MTGKIALAALGFGLLLVLGLAWLIKAGLKEPLQDLPVAKRDWGKVAVLVRQMHRFEMGKPGRAEYFLVAAAAEFVGRCPEAASAEPSYAAALSGSELRLELAPALTGGRCGRRGFEGSTMPADPRRLDEALPDLGKGPARVTFVQGSRRAVLVLRAEGDRIVLEPGSDPSGMLALGNTAYKRLPRVLYLALGLGRDSSSLWGGNIHVESADGKPLANDSIESPVQYCEAPMPYEHASGTASVDGKEISYQKGISGLGLDELYRELADGETEEGRKPAFTLYELRLDGGLDKRPK